MYQSLKSLQLSARRQVHTLLSGHHFSKLQGEISDFSELREYQAGDDIRKIHWMISAKRMTPYIRESHAYREISVALVALMDGSLYFAQGNDKQRKLAEIATILGYACEEQDNLFRGFCYTQNQEFITPPTKQLDTINQFSKTLFEASLLHSSLDNHVAIKRLFAHLSRPSLVFILSDFLKEIDLSLLAQKHEVLCIIVRDKEEEMPKIETEATLLCPTDNTQTHARLSTGNIKKYLKNLKKHDEKLVTHFSKYGICYVKIRTDEDSVKKLRLLFD